MIISELAYIEWKEVDPLDFTVTLHGVSEDIHLRSWRAILPDFEGEGVGIDPGRNLGISVVRGDNITIHAGRLPSRSAPLNHLSMQDAFYLSQHFTDVRGLPLVIEGAAHNAEVGQVLLAEIRAGFFLGMTYFNRCKGKLVPPKTIRKNVLGGGNEKAPYIWPTIDPNGADAGACALQAAGYEFRGYENDETT